MNPPLPILWKERLILCVLFCFLYNPRHKPSLAFISLLLQDIFKCTIVIPIYFPFSKRPTMARERRGKILRFLENAHNFSHQYLFSWILMAHIILRSLDLLFNQKTYRRTLHRQEINTWIPIVRVDPYAAPPSYLSTWNKLILCMWSFQDKGKKSMN